MKKGNGRLRAAGLSGAVCLTTALALIPGTNGLALAKANAQAPDTHLSGLTLEGITSSGGVKVLTDQPFRSDDVGYTVTVPSDVQSVVAKPTVSDPNQVSIVVNGATVANGQPSAPVSVASGGTNTFGISVVSKKPFASHSYVFTVYREKSTDHLLHSLSIQGATLGTDFSPRTLSYSTSVDYNQTSIQLTASPVSASDVVTINGQQVDGSGMVKVPLQEGQNTIPIKVSSGGPGQDSTTYQLSVYRATHDQLQNLTTNSGVPVRPFSPMESTYEVDVSKDTTQIQLTPTAFTPNEASITVDGQLIASGQASQPLSLKPGMNTFHVNVNGKTDYSVLVYRDPGDGNVHLIDNENTVTIRNGKISATFDKTSSVLTELHIPGQRDVLGSGYGYFFLNPSYVDDQGKSHTLSWSPGRGDANFHIAKQSADMTDIYFTFDTGSANDQPSKMGAVRI